MKLRILVCGYGTVGRFLTHFLLEERGRILRRYNLDLELAGILRRTEGAQTPSPFGVPVYFKAEEAIARVAPGLVVEVTGAIDEIVPLYELAFERGADVVTANKAVLAYHGRYLRDLARRFRRILLAEASVGGVVPILRTLHTSLAGDKFRKILGVWNGTCNYILTRMEAEGRTFDEILEDAKKKGYAEPDPRLDIEGNDTAYKAIVLAQVAFDLDLHPGDLPFRGISEIVPEDFPIVRDLGFRPKMVGWLERLPQGIQIYVGPALLPRDHPVAVLEGVTNGIYVEGEIGRGVFLSGRGAGPGPTTMAILGDIIEVARMRARGEEISYWGDRDQRLNSQALIPYRELSLPCYLRFHVLDRPGTLARIAGVLGDLGISIESMIQPIRHEINAVPIHLTTHSAPLYRIEEALARIYPPLLERKRGSQLQLNLNPLSSPQEISTRPPFWMPILS
jgi:homoserine dehydrogenase